MAFHHSTCLSGRNASTPTFGGKSTSGFSFPIQKQRNVFDPSNSPFRIPSTTSGSQEKTTIESCVPSYVATKVEGSYERILSISAMPHYLNKSHELLRWETYESKTKGPPNPFSTPNTFPSPSVFSLPFTSSFAPTTPSFTLPQSTQSFSNQPFKYNLPEPPKTPNFTTNNSTIPTPQLNPFSNTNLYPSQSQIPTPQVNPFSNTNLYPSQSQPFPPPSSTPSFTFSQPSSTPTFTQPSSTPAFTFSQPSSTASFAFSQPSSTPTFTQPSSTPAFTFSQPSSTASFAFSQPSSTPMFSQPSSTPAFTFSQPASTASFAFSQPSSTPTFTQPSSTPAFTFSQTSSTASFAFSQPSSTPTFTKPSSTPAFTFPQPSHKPMPLNSDLSDGKTSPCISNQPTITTSVNPFSHINLYPSQTQPSIPQPTPVSSMPTTFPKTLNPSFLNNNPIVSTAHTTPSTPLDSWPFTPRTSQIGQTAQKVDSVSSQASIGLTKVADFSSQTQYAPSSVVANPFATRSPIDRPNAAASRQHGISSLPFSNNHSITRRTTSLLRIRHVATRHPWLPSQRPSCDIKVPFFIDDVDKPAPFLPRENPKAWINNSVSLHSHSNSKGNEDNEISTGISSYTSIQKDQRQEHNDTAAEKHEADILATMPKLPEGGEYYTKPSVTELAAKEIAEPGWCTHVNSFVVGRKGYGSIKLFGETDVRNLHLESIVQFNDREVIVYPDQEKKPPVGQSINKACEVTLLNVKCMDRKTGKQYVEGRKVERFKELLMNKCSEQGAEFVSYDPVHGEWKFRVQHF